MIDYSLTKIFTLELDSYIRLMGKKLDIKEIKINKERLMNDLKIEIKLVGVSNEVVELLYKYIWDISAVVNRKLGIKLPGFNNILYPIVKSIKSLTFPEKTQVDLQIELHTDKFILDEINKYKAKQLNN